MLERGYLAFLCKNQVVYLEIKVKPAIIFDLDGVILDTESHWKRVSHQFLRDLIPTWSEADQASIFGLSAGAVYERLTKDFGMRLSWEDYLAEYQRLAQTIYGEASQPVPGALELIAFLDQSQYELGLATSAPRAWVQVVLERFYLGPRFRSVVTADDVGKLFKPSPEPYLRAAQGLGRVASECVAIEDSPKGIQSAKSAGLRCLALKREHNEKHDLSQADAVIESLEEIPTRTFGDWLERTLSARSLPV